MKMTNMLLLEQLAYATHIQDRETVEKGHMLRARETFLPKHDVSKRLRSSWVSSQEGAFACVAIRQGDAARTFAFSSHTTTLSSEGREDADGRAKPPSKDSHAGVMLP